MSDTPTVEIGFTDALREEAAGLYDAAFGEKLGVALPDRDTRLAVLSEGFEPRFSLTALVDGRLAGIAGFQTAAGTLTGAVTFGLLRRHLGVWKAARAWAILALFVRDAAKGQLVMDGISVAPEMRGRGVGSALLRALIEHARAEGYASIRLDVIDTNPAARRLYERIGFVATGTDDFGFLEGLLGFGSSTRMEYDLTV